MNARAYLHDCILIFFVLHTGPKVAGKNALAGGVILAMIEGLNIGIQRVVMPYFERKQQEEEGMIKVDLLDPPNDPMRPRSKSIWQPTEAPTSSKNSDGFDMDKMYEFEKNSGSEGSWGGTGGDAYSSSGGGSGSSSLISAGSSESETQSDKPFWKFW